MVDMLYQDKIAGLRARLKRFILAVIALAKKIPKDEVGRIFIGQLIRAATSAGANYEEASETKSGKDLVYRLSVVCKELKEAKFWLDLVSETYPDLSSECASLIQEAGELVKIFFSVGSKYQT